MSRIELGDVGRGSHSAPGVLAVLLCKEVVAVRERVSLHGRYVHAI
jgi:hypothetical protein